MDTIIIIGSVQAFFLAIFVYSKKNKSTADYVLGFWLLFICVHLLQQYLLVTGFQSTYPFYITLGFSFPLLQGPLMFLYVATTTSQNNRFKSVYWFHSLPFLIFSLYSILDFYFHIEIKNMFNSDENIFTAISLARSYTILISGPLYVILSLFMLRKYRKNIAENFSYTEQISLNWLRYVVLGFGFVWLLVIFLSLFFTFPVIANSVLGKMIYISLTIMVFFVGYNGIKQQVIYKSNPLTKIKVYDAYPTDLTINKEQYKHSVLTQKEAKEYLGKMLDYFKNEKPYLNGKLSLNDVAKHLDISTNHLSQIINEQLGKNFYDFVNEYRIQEVKSLLCDSEYKNLTLVAIAFESGFNSKTSFNVVFKKITGLTPSQYLKQKNT